METPYFQNPPQDGQEQARQQPVQGGGQPPQQQARPGSGKAVASLVLGIVALLCTFYSSLIVPGLLAIALAIIGLVLGVQARRALPLYHLAASAGTGQFLDGDSSEPIDAAGAPPEADFAVRIAGDSMEPEIHDGQIVFVRSRDDLESGRVGIFIFRGEAYCKRLQHDARGAHLVSINARYKPIALPAGEAVRVCGEVVGLGPMAD